MNPVRLSLIVYTAVFMLAAALNVRAQETTPAVSPEMNQAVSVPLGYLIDVPTAATLPQKTIAVDMRMYPNGGVLAGVGLGLFSPLTATIYYGGENIVGEGEINWNPQVGVDVRLRIFDETMLLPGIAVGFSSQGLGGYRKNEERYVLKSKGLYAVASRNYIVLKNCGIHGGINYSLEDEDGDDDITFFAGLDFELVGGVEFLADFDFGINDNEGDAFGRNHGYLNAGLRWRVSPNFSVELHIRNLTANRKGVTHVGRGFKLSYQRPLS